MQEAGFDPSEFEWANARGEYFEGRVPCLVHTPTRSTFVFDFWRGQSRHRAEFTPGVDTTVAEAVTGDWATQLKAVQLWLTNVQREQSSPNLWAELEKQRELLAAAAGSRSGEDSNSPFDLEEQAQIAAQLNEIKELLVQTHQADRLALESRIEYLREASTRMGRRDWLNIFIGTIFGWALNGLVPPEGVREVLTMATHGLGHLFGGGLPQLPMA